MFENAGHRERQYATIVPVNNYGNFQSGSSKQASSTNASDALTPTNNEKLKENISNICQNSREGGFLNKVGNFFSKLLFNKEMSQVGTEWDTATEGQGLLKKIGKGIVLGLGGILNAAAKTIAVLGPVVGAIAGAAKGGGLVGGFVGLAIGTGASLLAAAPLAGLGTFLQNIVLTPKGKDVDFAQARGEAFTSMKEVSGMSTFLFRGACKVLVNIPCWISLCFRG